MTVSRPLSFVVGLSLPVLVAFAAFGKDIPIMILLLLILATPWILYFREAATERRRLDNLETRVARLEDHVDALYDDNDPDDPDEAPVRGEPSNVVALSDRRVA